MEKNKKMWVYTTIILTSIRLIAFISVLIYFMIKVYNAKTIDWEENIDIPLSISEKIFTIFAFSFSIIAITLISVSYVFMFIFEQKQGWKFLVSSILILSIEGIAYSFKNTQDFKTSIKWKKWATKDITAVGLLLGLYLLVDFVSGFIPALPFWITISFKYIFLYFGAFVLPLTASITLCLLASIMTVLMPGTAVFTFWQFMFDYLLPTTLFFTAGYFKPNIENTNKYYKFYSWIIFVSVPIIFLYCCRVIAGVVYWLNPGALGEDPFYAFQWQSTIGYSMIFNSFNTITDYITLLILTPLVCNGLKVIKQNYFVD
ncbi:energy-coupled thiamine transporter ThiT [Spiroplasma culicicola]|uniref:Transmembrane protein n=1 Tax=Spiroplasma culicicola AES-1 TaxID=1276246 RepID=W6AFZ7_9MOLU|nr:energy-coupled thiamine transporter ThiT [Spiroplasma culicicola]AHI52634.1 hypothetical protein SCULI_v1c02930 [Spiroplasma culicicola AES-1]